MANRPTQRPLGVPGTGNARFLAGGRRSYHADGASLRSAPGRTGVVQLIAFDVSAAQRRQSGSRGRQPTAAEAESIVSAPSGAAAGSALAPWCAAPDGAEAITSGLDHGDSRPRLDAVAAARLKTQACNGYQQDNFCGAGASLRSATSHPSTSQPLPWVAAAGCAAARRFISPLIPPYPPVDCSSPQQNCWCFPARLSTI